MDEKDGTVRWTGCLDIYAADTVHRQLLEQLSSQASLVLDLAGVTECDLAGVQLLCAAQKTAAQSGRTIQVIQLSPAVQDCCLGLGLSCQSVTSHSS